MKNADHLLFFANVIAGFFVGLTHLVTALNTLNDIDIIFAPHGQSILCLAGRALCTRDKAFTYSHLSLPFIQIHPSRRAGVVPVASHAGKSLPAHDAPPARGRSAPYRYVPASAHAAFAYPTGGNASGRAEPGADAYPVKSAPYAPVPAHWRRSRGRSVSHPPAKVRELQHVHAHAP